MAKLVAVCGSVIFLSDPVPRIRNAEKFLDPDSGGP